jgi:hypothetical protein
MPIAIALTVLCMAFNIVFLERMARAVPFVN